MKQKNQAVIVAGFLALLATATIAASYNAQTAKAQFGKTVIASNAQCTAGAPGGGTCTPASPNAHPSWGGEVSAAAKSNPGQIADFRANGCKITQTSGGCP